MFIAQRLERRNINDINFIVQFSIQTDFEKFVQRREKGRERFSRTGWRGDERVRAGLDCRPAEIAAARWANRIFAQTIWRLAG